MIRDAVDGEYAVKLAGSTYLPRLIKQSDPEYDAYRMRALFFEATRRTLNGLVGMVMRKDPAVEAKETTVENFLKHLTKNNLSLNGFASVVMHETLMMNKYGILADLPPQITTASEPWLVGYPAESMINWDYDIDADGKTILTRMVLEEEYESVKEDDRFVVEHKKQWRVLELVAMDLVLIDIEAMENPPAIIFNPQQRNVYRVQVWRAKKDLEGAAGAGARADDFTLVEEFFPLKQGVAMDAIPFVVVTSEDEDDEEQKPPIEGLASVNMSHYRTSADLEWGRHWTALPTPYIVGLSEQQDLSIGSSKAWVITGVDASQVKVGMLEFAGQGLSALENALVEKQQQMAILGARLLEEQKKAAEAFETHELRAAGEHSVLASVANGVSEGLNAALAWMTLWDASLGAMIVKLNTEFVSIGMSPEFLTSMLKALQASRMSFKTFFFNMQQRGMYPEDHTEEDEVGLIDDDKETFAVEVEVDAFGEDEEEGEDVEDEEEGEDD